MTSQSMFLLSYVIFRVCAQGFCSSGTMGHCADFRHSSVNMTFGTFAQPLRSGTCCLSNEKYGTTHPASCLRPNFFHISSPPGNYLICIVVTLFPHDDQAEEPRCRSSSCTNLPNPSAIHATTRSGAASQAQLWSLARQNPTPPRFASNKVRSFQSSIRMYISH